MCLLPTFFIIKCFLSKESANYCNFSNVRYAQPPVGNLRFDRPKEPLVNRTAVNDGLDGRVCPQATPGWATERGLSVDAYFKGEGNFASFTNEPPPGVTPGSMPPSVEAPQVSEDCLFLDVIVPKAVYHCPEKKAPVMVWTFGDGYYEGSKQSQGNPAGLVGQSMTNPNSEPGIIYVAINYRLAAFRWLAGPTFVKEGGVPNVGLHDQRHALRWVHDHIHSFGGDPDRVTLMGASGGAAMTMHQITAFGGTMPAEFQQAMMSSPAFPPNPYNSSQELTYQTFLKNANLTSLAELRAASTETLIAANEASVYYAIYGGNSGFGPVVDGNIVPQLPNILLAEGKIAPEVKTIFAGHSMDEGFIFSNPAVQNTTAFDAQLKVLLPYALPSVLSTIENQLYPAIFDNPNKYGYNDTISRLAAINGDYLLNCNVYRLLETFGPITSSAYLFEEGPSLHAEETPYFFYNYGPTPDAYGFEDLNGTVAQAWQDWVVAFVATGKPNGKGNAEIPFYGSQRTMGSLSNAGVGLPVIDSAGLQRCEFWNKELFV